MSAARLLPWAAHEVIEYLAGIFFILAPFIFDLRDGVAFPLFVGIGVVILAVALLTPGLASVADVLPVKAHATLDYLLALFLILAPFVFGFSDDDVALSISMFLGVAHFVISIITAFPERAGPAEPEVGGSTPAVDESDQIG